MIKTCTFPFFGKNGMTIAHIVLNNQRLYDWVVLWLHNPRYDNYNILFQVHQTAEMSQMYDTGNSRLLHAHQPAETGFADVFG